MGNVRCRYIPNGVSTASVDPWVVIGIDVALFVSLGLDSSAIEAVNPLNQARKGPLPYPNQWFTGHWKQYTEDALLTAVLRLQLGWTSLIELKNQSLTFGFVFRAPS